MLIFHFFHHRAVIQTGTGRIFYFFFCLGGVRGKCAFSPSSFLKMMSTGSSQPPTPHPRSIYLRNGPELLPRSAAVAPELLTKVGFLAVLPPVNTACLPPGSHDFILCPPSGITTASASKTLFQLFRRSHVAGHPHFDLEACCGCQLLSLLPTSR